MLQRILNRLCVKPFCRRIAPGRANVCPSVTGAMTGPARLSSPRSPVVSPLACRLPLAFHRTNLQP